jgi:hypothetical protein
MWLGQRFSNILRELRAHAPFTMLGATTGILCMLLFKSVGTHTNYRLFQVFHPLHVVLSAVVTASLFKLYRRKASFLTVLLVGYVGAVGVATLSDCILPFFGEDILGVAIPMHGEMHSEGGTQQHSEATDGQEHSRPVGSIRERIHLGFIEDWYLVNPAALLGIFLGFLRPHTKFPHAGHILVSTWASSFHVLMNTRRELDAILLVGVFVVLFIAVWLPCCVSDIVFPLMFVGESSHHTHAHRHRHEVEATT